MIPAFKSVTNRKIKVFISSTFRDMNLERDIIVNSVFPRLREAFKEKLADVVEVDLRWGITEEMAESGKVLEICIGEVLRCAPFFVGLLGDRYGSPASKDEIEALPNNYKKAIGEDFQEGISITELEMRAGVFVPSHNSCSCFFLKKSYNPNEGIDAQNRLKELRDYVINTQDYSFYTSIEELETLLFVALKDYIDRELPENPELPYNDDNYFSHLNILKSSSAKYVPNYRQTKKFQEQIQTKRKLYLYGEKGTGKTACLSDLVKREGITNNRTVFFHYTSAGNESTHINNIYHRLWLFLTSIINTNESIVNDNYGDAVRNILLNHTFKEPLLLFFDAVEQIDDKSAIFKLFNLTEVNPNINVICSGTAFYQYLEPFTCTVKLLTPKQVENITRNSLKKFGKTLDAEDYVALKNNPFCANPLFLNVLIAQLRMYGAYESLKDFLKHLLKANNVADLFETILQRLQKYFAQKNLETEKIYEALSLLVYSYEGMSETEIQNLLHFPTLAWSVLYSTIENFVIEHDGLLRFNHDLIVEAIKTQLSNRTTAYEQFTKDIIISNFNDPSPRRYKEVTYQLRKFYQADKLLILIEDADCLLFLAQHEDNLLISCLSILTEKQQHIIDGVLSKIDSTKLPLIASAFCRSGCFFACINIAEEAKKRRVNNQIYIETLDQHARAIYKLGKNQFQDAIKIYKELCDFYKSIYPDDTIGYASRYFLAGVAYNSAGYLDSALEIYEYCVKQFHEHQIQTTQVAWAMDNLGNGYFKRGQLEKAKSIAQQAIRICIQLCGEFSSETAWAYCYAWPALYASGESERALKLMKTAYEIYNELFMHSGTEFAWAAQNYGSAKAIYGSYGEAINFYQICIDINDRTINKEDRPHAYSLTAYNNMANAYYLMGKPEEAIRLAKLTYEQSVKKNGIDHVYTVNFLLNYGIMTSDLSKITQAIDQYARINSKLLDLYFALLMRAKLYLSQNKYQMAEADLQRCGEYASDEPTVIDYIKYKISLLFQNKEDKELNNLSVFDNYKLYLTHSNNSCMIILPEI